MVIHRDIHFLVPVGGNFLMWKEYGNIVSFPHFVVDRKVEFGKEDQSGSNDSVPGGTYMDRISTINSGC